MYPELGGGSEAVGSIALARATREVAEAVERLRGRSVEVTREELQVEVDRAYAGIHVVAAGTDLHGGKVASIVTLVPVTVVT